MASISDEFKIPKLSQDNYYAWSVRTKAALIQKNCWQAIDPGFSEPLTEDEEKANQKALSFLFLVVSDSYLDDIGHCTLAKEAWDILEEVNSNFGLLHVVILLRELVNVRKTKDMTMQDYMSTIQNLNRKVATGGFNFDDRTLALFYLLGLPLDTYEGLVRSLEKDENTITSKTVKAKLILEEKRMQREEKERTLNRDEDAEEALKALHIKKKTQNQNEQTTQKKTSESDRKEKYPNTPRFVICFACGRKGHIARDCELQKQTEHKSSAGEEEREDVKRAGLAMLKYRALCAKQKSTDGLVWILDSGATDHMTSHREKIFEFIAEEGTVSIANGKTIPSKGRGNLTMKLKEEYGGWTITLSNVLYVPDLEDNLLSMNRIDEKGCRQIVRDGRIEVTDGDEILFTAFRNGHLYCIEEENEDENKSMLIEKKSERLWHRRMHFLSTTLIKENSTQTPNKHGRFTEKADEPCSEDDEPCRGDGEPCREDDEPCRGDDESCREDDEPCREDDALCREDDEQRSEDEHTVTIRGKGEAEQNDELPSEDDEHLIPKDEDEQDEELRTELDEQEDDGHILQEDENDKYNDFQCQDGENDGRIRQDDDRVKPEVQPYQKSRKSERNKIAKDCSSFYKPKWKKHTA